MPAKYSSKDQERALERLRANQGDGTRTAEELGLSRQTLFNWMHLDKSEESNVSNLSNMSTIQPVIAPLATSDADVVERLYKLEDRLNTDDRRSLRDLAGISPRIHRQSAGQRHDSDDRPRIEDRIAAATPQRGSRPDRLLPHVFPPGVTRPIRQS